MFHCLQKAIDPFYLKTTERGCWASERGEGFAGYARIYEKLPQGQKVHCLHSLKGKCADVYITNIHYNLQ